MKWQKDDIEKYVEAKEYIDTVVIPVQSFHLEEDTQLVKDTFSSEVLSIYAHEIEKELSGRLLLTPTYTYNKKSDLSKEIERMNEWIDDLKTQPFEHIFLLTLDVSLKKVERDLDGHLLWVPGLKPTNLQSQEAVQFIRSQIEQISELIRAYW
ncbi:MAG TPA: DUF2487 family protein [Pseudogracilibacillus sp.]|nr:DUF2487 family protein [Pseudogracilibacillus sp.]